MSLNYNLWQDAEGFYDDLDDDDVNGDHGGRESGVQLDTDSDTEISRFEQKFGDLIESEVDEKKVNYILLGRPYSGGKL